MTDDTQTPAEITAAPAAVAQDAPAAVPAPEVAPVVEAAVDPVSAASDAAPAAPAVEAAPDEVEIEITETITIHNPNALRGIPAGPAPHPRTV